MRPGHGTSEAESSPSRGCMDSSERLSYMAHRPKHLTSKSVSSERMNQHQREQRLPPGQAHQHERLPPILVGQCPNVGGAQEGQDGRRKEGRP